MRSVTGDAIRRGLVSGVMIISLCGILTACALFPGAVSAKNSRVGNTSTGGQSQPGAPAIALKMNAIASATVGGVQLRSTITCGPWVTLAPHAATYSASELAAIQAFTAQSAGGIVGGSDNVNGYTADGSNPLPPTLLDVPGYQYCSGTYEVTNTGSGLVQINGAGYQPTQAPADFSYDYHLLDACPYLQLCGCDGCGAAFGCNYSVDIQMTMSQSVALKNFQSGDPTCPTPLSLQPGETQPISVQFDKPVGNKGVWFRGSPVLSVTTAQGTSTVIYPTLLDNLVFVNIGDHIQGTVPTPGPSDGPAPAPQDSNVRVECFTEGQGGSFHPLTSFKTTLDNFTSAANLPTKALCY